MTHDVMSHYGLHRPPFTAPTRPSDMYLSDEAMRAIAAIRDSISTRTPVVLSGRPGLGKTMLMEHALQGMNVVRVHTVPRSRLSGSHISSAILSDIAGQPYHGCLEIRARKVRDCLMREAHNGRPVILLIDHAHLVRDALVQDVRALRESGGIFQPHLIPILCGRDGQRRLSLLLGDATTIRQPEIDVPGYIEHAISAAGGNADTIFTGAGVSAIAAHHAASSYPSLHALVTESMSVASRLPTHERIDADIIDPDAAPMTAAAAA